MAFQIRHLILVHDLNLLSRVMAKLSISFLLIILLLLFKIPQRAVLKSAKLGMMLNIAFQNQSSFSTFFFLLHYSKVVDDVLLDHLDALNLAKSNHEI